ncbi:MAG TPA: MFS transporter [Desulfobacteria bacterium]|nr:MFS transporter [Desulfobacteria bacterium]
MLVLIQGGTVWPWDSAPVILLFFIFVCGLGLFVKQERKAREPIMPLSIWQNRLISTANIASLTTGVIMIGVTTFLPTYVQGVLGKSPTVAGFTLGAMSIGWPLAAAAAGRLILKVGVRSTALLGGVLLVIGGILFVLLGLVNTTVWAATGSLLIGAGMGFSSTTFIIAIQNSVNWSTRGVATAANMFMRIVGNTVGAALLGGMLNVGIKAYLVGNGGGNYAGQDVTNLLLSPVTRNKLSTSMLTLAEKGLTFGLHRVYLVVLAFALISLVCIAFLPKVTKFSEKEII